MSLQNLYPFKQLNMTATRTLLGKAGKIFIFLVYLISLLGVSTLRAKAATITFTGQELLGRPTDTSITISVLPDSNITLYYEYGTTSGVYTGQTADESATGGQPKVMVISGLAADTKYYYRMQYSTDSGSTWTVRAENSFYTQRAAGSSFTFTITSDSHVNIMLGSASEWTKTMNNIVADHPDFEIDLGDTFAMDDVTSVATAETNYKFQYQFFNLVSASAPIFLAVGNHEEQEGWHLDDTGNPATSKPVMGTNAQKKYFLNPVPGSFYSGDTNTYSFLDGDHLREDYYAWTWGDALFVVLDPYWYTMTKPFTGNTGGGETSDTGSGDRWDWTLGVEQYNWLKQTLEGSDAKYKFMFAHHMTGGSDDYVRGGANPANLVEWGGYNEAGTTYEWDTKRPAASGWGSQPIHQLMVANGVSAFFHGHDHQYAYEKRDGIVYQSLPSAGFTGSGFDIYTTGSGYTIEALASDGHLRVTVAPEKTTVDYIKSTGATNAYTYDIIPAGPTHDLTVAVSPVGGGTTNPTAGVHSYSEGSVVPVNATAASGYKFDHWEGDCTGSGACSVTMGADKSVTAVFTLNKARDDYDGDGRTDAIKFVDSSGTAWWYKSSTSAWDGKWLGAETLNYVGASDFDGDGQTDLAKFIPSTGAVWYYLSNTSAWDGRWLGSEAFTYVAGSDFDGDGQTDPAKFVSSTGAVWYLQSSTGTWDGKWLGPETLNYVSGSDFDGDGRTDPAKFVPSTKVLWYLGSQTGTWTGVYMGSETFSYVAASDFDGDGQTDPAKFIASTGVLWYLSSLTSSWVGVSLGTGTYTYVPGCDFNGDGQTDPAKYDAGTHWLSWYNGSTDIDMGTDTFTIGNGQ